MENKEVDSRAEIETGSLPKVGKGIFNFNLNKSI